MFVAIEGIDGSGKSTLIRNLLSAADYNTKIAFATPTMLTADGRRFRKIKNDKTLMAKTPVKTNLQILLGDMEKTTEIFAPAITRNLNDLLIVADRWFLASIAYQAVNATVESPMITMHDAMVEFYRYFCDSNGCPSVLVPDVCIILDGEIKTFQKRLEGRAKTPTDLLIERQECYREAFKHFVNNHAQIIKEAGCGAFDAKTNYVMLKADTTNAEDILCTTLKLLEV
jgi:thymidylate kinase